MIKNVAICGQKVTPSIFDKNYVEIIEIEGIPISCGLIHTQQPDFILNDPENEFNVLIQKKAFSCNYRDKNLLLKMATQGGDRNFYVLGSEFVGEVVAVGSGVDQFKVGDRVIGDGCYPFSGVDGVRPGLPTNNGSKEYQIFHQRKLIKIPPEMPDPVAAAFSIGGQTSYSMIRKLNIKPGETVLVTAAKSNTSLFTINALKNYEVDVYATTTSMQFEAELKELGVKELILIDSNFESWREHDMIQKIVDQKGGFDCVVDPFFDLHLGKVVEVMNFGGRYITCGLYDQYSHLTGKSFDAPEMNLSKIMNLAILKNLQINGNCIGLTSDLEAAIQDYQEGKLKVIIDSVFNENQIGAFFERTYTAPDRFGKVVLQYSH